MGVDHCSGDDSTAVADKARLLLGPRLEDRSNITFGQRATIGSLARAW